MGSIPGQELRAQMPDGADKKFFLIFFKVERKANYTQTGAKTIALVNSCACISVDLTLKLTHPNLIHF